MRDKEIEEAIEIYEKLHKDTKFTDEDYKKAIEEAKKQIEYHKNLNDICCFMTDTTTLKALLSLIEKQQEKLEFKQFGDLDSLQFENTYLDKQVIRDKLKELEEDLKNYKEEYTMWCYDLECLEDIRVKEARINILKELLEE